MMLLYGWPGRLRILLTMYYQYHTTPIQYSSIRKYHVRMNSVIPFDLWLYIFMHAPLWKKAKTSFLTILVTLNMELQSWLYCVLTGLHLSVPPYSYSPRHTYTHYFSLVLSSIGLPVILYIIIMYYSPLPWLCSQMTAVPSVRSDIIIHINTYM